MSEVIESKVATITTQRVLIEGRVQGVGYRAWVNANARKRGISGWVRNLSNGAVEALFSGPADVVEQLIQECWEGPLASRVLNVTAAPSRDRVEAGFTQRPTI